MKIQVTKEHYNFLKYVNLPRFISYYYQLKFILERTPSSVLEIGVGNNFLKKNLPYCIEYRSLDIDAKLNPDYIGSISDLNTLPNRTFDIVCAFQVLEHLPFYLFKKSIENMARVSNKYIIISLPYKYVDFRILIKIPLLKEFKFNLTFPRFWEGHKFDGEHYWEVGAKGYSLYRIKNILSEVGTIEKIFQPFENPYHIFFIIKKQNNEN